MAKEVFSQYETTHTVNPARIVSMFTDEDEQREVAGLFNATIHQVEGKNDKATALRETVVRIKQNSIDYRSKHLAPTDMEGMMRIIEDKRALEELQKYQNKEENKMAKKKEQKDMAQEQEQRLNFQQKLIEILELGKKKKNMLEYQEIADFSRT